MAEIGLFEAMYTARALRRLKPDPVPEDLITRILEAGTQAPSGGNTQNWIFIVVRDQAQRQRLGAVYRKASDEVAEIYAARGRPAHMTDEQFKRFIDAGRHLWEHLGDAHGPQTNMTTRQYARLVSEWIGSVGLDPRLFGTHSLRRTKATLIYRRTGNLRAVQLLLGHTKVESTVKYHCTIYRRPTSRWASRMREQRCLAAILVANQIAEWATTPCPF